MLDVPMSAGVAPVNNAMPWNLITGVRQFMLLLRRALNIRRCIVFGCVPVHCTCVCARQKNNTLPCAYTSNSARRTC